MSASEPVRKEHFAGVRSLVWKRAGLKVSGEKKQRKKRKRRRKKRARQRTWVLKALVSPAACCKRESGLPAEHFEPGRGDFRRALYLGQHDNCDGECGTADRRMRSPQPD